MRINKPKLKKLYFDLSILFMTGLVFFIILNVFISFGVNILSKPKPIKVYGYDTLAKAYPEMNKKEIKKLLEESWSIKLEYEPYTGFKIKETSGEYINIASEGFRKIAGQCNFPPTKENYNIFFFGGSTTFGLGVSDEATIPSKVQAILNTSHYRINKVCVYNFARPHFFSSQERILFEKLLSEGNIPNMVIFIDGLNDYYYAKLNSHFSDNFKSFMNGDIILHFRDLPILRLIQKFPPILYSEEEANEKYIISATERYFTNMKIINSLSKEFGIRPFFVIQPVPNHNYNLSYHLFAKDISELSGPLANTFAGYNLLDARYKELYNNTNIIWLDDIQEFKKENLYVDKVHYTKDFNEEIANYIVERVKPELI